MNTIRKGKIAKLPREIRQQLNEHLVDGMEAEPLLAWVNGLAETQAVLQEKFDGNAITPQNLSDWRNGGHQDWLRAERQRELAEQLLEDGKDLEAIAEGPGMNERLGLVFTLELAAELRRWQSETGDPKERWRQLRELLGELAVLRREEQRAGRAKLTREKWERESQRSAESNPSQPVEELKAPEAPPLRIKRRKMQKQNHFRRSGDWFEQEVVEVSGAYRKGEPLPEWAQQALGEEKVQTKPEVQSPTPHTSGRVGAASPLPNPSGTSEDASSRSDSDKSREEKVQSPTPTMQENGTQSHQIQPNPAIENVSRQTELAEETRKDNA